MKKIILLISMMFLILLTSVMASEMQPTKLIVIKDLTMSEFALPNVSYSDVIRTNANFNIYSNKGIINTQGYVKVATKKGSKTISWLSGDVKSNMTETYESDIQIIFKLTATEIDKGQVTKKRINIYYDKISNMTHIIDITDYKFRFDVKIP